jgi:hypothetical protein
MAASAHADPPPRRVKQRTLRKTASFFGGFCPAGSGDTDRSAPYFQFMFSTLLVIGGVLVGLLVLLALIVSLSARPQTIARTTGRPGPTPSWVADAGRPHPDAWSPLSTAGTNEMPAVR